MTEPENGNFTPPWGSHLVDSSLFETDSAAKAAPSELTPGAQHILRTRTGPFVTDMLVTLVHIDQSGYQAAAVGVTYCHTEFDSVDTIGVDTDGFVKSLNAYEDSAPTGYFLPVRSQDQPPTPAADTIGSEDGISNHPN